jgi:peptide/nickel transport system substrate-binding protein
VTLGCGAPRPPGGAQTITLAVRADVTGFFPNPPIWNEGYTLEANRNIFEGLVELDREFRLRPALASHWENPDERTYVFDLRPGLEFSDGRPVTADDVVASLEAPRRRGWVTRDYLQAIDSVRALGRSRVEVKTRFPYLILLSKLPWGLVLPRAALDQSPVPTIGTGPYKLASWTPGRGFVLLLNPRYRGPRPAFDRAVFDVVPDGEERLDRVRKGLADVAEQVPFESIAAAEKAGLTVIARPGNRMLFLCLRVDAPPFSDPRVREAFDLALDRVELNRRVFLSRAEPASQMVPATIVGFDPGLTVVGPDRERARRLLREAGFGGGLRVRLDGPVNRYVNDVGVLHEVARQLADVGVTVEVNGLEKGALYALTDRGESVFHLLGWACQSGEAGGVLDAVLHSRGGGLLGGDNTTGLADPTLDQLIEDSNEAKTLQARTAALRRALRRVANLRAVLPLVVQTEAVAVSKRVRWDPPLNFALRLKDMELASPAAHP